ncbi:MAG TPA: Asp-tRNA(Asn)/Glu-tRNA(Gln) amidotransferase subunit GatA [bacterium]|nr:Asp-tRNA(Asn)/Glu-tRNA(Gln) amidotransferase subunit GatA [bacterium]
MDFGNLTIKKAQEAIKKREFSVWEMVNFFLGKIEEKNKDIKAYLEVFNDVEDQAKRIDKKIANGDAGNLAGIPVAIKDNILIKGKIASASSKILENYKAVYDATVIKKIRNAGAVFLGRTNMDEFAMGSSTENSVFGPTKNPHDLERVPGGSSGGSAAAVAMGGALSALGSDTGGSIRQPASFCGVVGLKPTYGAVSRYGLIAMASSLDQIGPITKTVEDAEIVFNVIKGQDEMDSTSVDTHQSSIVDYKKLRVGVLKYDRSGVDDEINKTLDESVEKLRSIGHDIMEIDPPNLEYSLPCYYIIMPAEVSANLARFDGIRYGLSKQGKNLLEDYMETRAQGFGKEVKRRILLGTYVLSAGYYDAYYGKAQKVRNLIKKDFEKDFKKVDAIILPTSPTVAFKIGEKTEKPLQMYLSDIFTVSANLAGVPALSLPTGKNKEKLPVGVQLIAPWFKEDILFNLGKKIQS